jgi:RNA polymerase sigma-70 factor (ECF subfamily)
MPVNRSVRQLVSASFKAELVALAPKLRRFAYSLSGTRTDADDLVQSACERALANAHRFQPGTRMDSWMYRIVQNLWLDQRRRAKVRGYAVAPEEAGLTDGGCGARAPEDRLLLAQVRAAMARLPEAQRVVLALVAVEGRSYRETADILDVPIGTVMSRLSRAREALIEHTGGLGAA